MALKIFFNQHYIEIEYDYAVQPSPEDRLSSHLKVIWEQTEESIPVLQIFFGMLHNPLSYTRVNSTPVR